MLGYFQRTITECRKLWFDSFYKGYCNWSYDEGEPHERTPTLFSKGSINYNEALSQIGSELLTYPLYHTKSNRIRFIEYKG